MKAGGGNSVGEPGGGVRGGPGGRARMGAHHFQTNVGSVAADIVVQLSHTMGACLRGPRSIHTAIQNIKIELGHVVHGDV